MDYDDDKEVEMELSDDVLEEISADEDEDEFDDHSDREEKDDWE